MNNNSPAALLRAQTTEARAAIAAAVREALSPYARGTAYVVPMAAVLTSGRRPAASPTPC